MKPNDFRTVSEDTISFYVFDDLRYNQNGRKDFAIFRYDLLEEAIAKFREIPAEMTPALGMHLSAVSELDLIHRREGEVHLVSDYMSYPKWRQSPDVLSSVKALWDQFRPEWRMDGKCIGTTILIPLERNFERIPDPAFADKQLSPKRATFYMDKPNPLTAINEVYVPGEGWLDFESFYKKATDFGFHNPHCMKAQQFNVNYIDANGHTSQADVSPMDMQILFERYRMQHSEPYIINTMKERLAEEVSELVVQVPFKRDEYKESVEKALKAGEVDCVVKTLETMRDYGQTDHDIAQAIRLLARVQGIQERKPSLEQQMVSASEKSAQQKEPAGRNNIQPER